MTHMRTDVEMLQGPTTEHARFQKGNVLVEFALILPVFLLILFGMVNISIALYNKTVLAMATREGARAGARFVANRTNTITFSNATAATRLACQDNLISFGTMGIPTPACSITNNILTVSATVNYTPIYTFPGFSISAQSSMRIE
jgi:Flp pilus assembly protein TadG